jgi:hypothetical protein
MAVAVCVAVGWTTHKITKAEDDLAVLRQDAMSAKVDVDRLSKERDDAQREAQDAKLARAQMAGHLEAVAPASDKRPTTRPTGLIQRVAAIFSEQ